jgi:hypothetical protein
VIVAVKNSVHLLECARLEILLPIAELEKRLDVLHHLDECGAEFTGSNVDIGRVRSVGPSDLAEIIRFGLDNYRAVVKSFDTLTIIQTHVSDFYLITHALGAINNQCNNVNQFVTEPASMNPAFL